MKHVYQVTLIKFLTDDQDKDPRTKVFIFKEFPLNILESLCQSIPDDFRLKYKLEPNRSSGDFRAEYIHKQFSPFRIIIDCEKVEVMNEDEEVYVVMSGFITSSTIMLNKLRKYKGQKPSKMVDFFDWRKHQD